MRQLDDKPAHGFPPAGCRCASSTEDYRDHPGERRSVSLSAMTRVRKFTDDHARAALAIFEFDEQVKQQEVANLFGISRTELRRGLERLAETDIQDEPDLKDRIAVIRSRIRLHGKSPALTNEQIQRAKIIFESGSAITADEIAKLFGVSRASLYRSLARLEDQQGSTTGE